jgi:uncharacterized membrane protein (TIGR02234 family)
MSDSEPSASGLSSGREYVLALCLLAGGAALALVAAQATWVTATEPEVGYVSGFKGSEVAPAMVAFALVALAGGVAVIATRGWVRRVVGGLLAVAGLVVVAGPVSVLADPAGAVRHPLALVSGGADTVPREVSVAWWWCALAALGGVCVVAGALLTVWHGSRWATMASRYDAPAGRSRSAARTPDAWTQLDQGLDPTFDPTFDPTTDPTADPTSDPTAEPDLPE